MHRYTYVAGDPVNATDPLGLFIFVIPARMIGAGFIAGVIDANVQFFTNPHHEINWTQVGDAASDAMFLGILPGSGATKVNSPQKTAQMCVADNVKKESIAVTNALQNALQAAKPTGGHPNQLMSTLEDGTRVIFRKDFGEKAHAIGGPFQGAGKVDHYNIEIQSAAGRTLENLHVVPNSNGGFTWWGKDKVIKQ